MLSGTLTRLGKVQLPIVVKRVVLTQSWLANVWPLFWALLSSLVFDYASPPFPSLLLISTNTSSLMANSLLFLWLQDSYMSLFPFNIDYPASLLLPQLSLCLYKSSFCIQAFLPLMMMSTDWPHLSLITLSPLGSHSMWSMCLSTRKHSEAGGSLEGQVKVGFFSWALVIPLVKNWSMSPKIVLNQKIWMIVSRELEVPKARIDRAVTKTGRW